MRWVTVTASLVCTTAGLLAGCGSPEVQGVGSPLIRHYGDLLVSCGRGAPFPLSAMDRGVSGSGIEADVAAALNRLNTTAGIDAPLRGVPASKAQWKILRTAPTDHPTSALVAIGPWTAAIGPGSDALFVDVHAVDGSWEANGWGNCNLEPALAEGRGWVSIQAVTGSLDPQSSRLRVGVTERECASGRDPTPYLHDPYIVETDDTVTVYWTIDRPGDGFQSCEGRGPVEQTINLDTPIGHRHLLDGSTWPPTTIKTGG